jgi:hypothetical protein
MPNFSGQVQGGVTVFLIDMDIPPFQWGDSQISRLREFWFSVMIG